MSQQSDGLRTAIRRRVGRKAVKMPRLMMLVFALAAAVILVGCNCH